MILDDQALFSDKQAVTVDAASTNVIKTNGNIAKGTPVEMFCQVETTVTGATSIEIKVQTSDTEDFSSPVTLATTGALSAATLVAGYRAALKFLPNGVKKYIRLFYDVTGTGTAGAFTAGIVDGTPESYQN